jgi:predicted double-glycine peptidase
MSCVRLQIRFRLIAVPPVGIAACNRAALVFYSVAKFRMHLTPWLESAAVTLLAVAGVLLGYWFSRLPKPYWTFGYFVPLSLIVVYGLANRYPALSLEPPIAWMMMGRNKFAVVGFVATMVLTTPLSRVPARRARIYVAALMVVIVALMSVWPFLAPAFNRTYLSRLKTRLDADGICLQSNDYNCGPAAAVTALRQLGFPAEEGEVAILAYTSSATGTPPDILARALSDRYAKDGLVSEYRVFRSLDELKEAGLTLAVIKHSFMLDHYVTVFEVTEDQVVIGDPLKGKGVMAHDEFEKLWRFVGVVLRRGT